MRDLCSFPPFYVIFISTIIYVLVEGDAARGRGVEQDELQGPLQSQPGWDCDSVPHAAPSVWQISEDFSSGPGHMLM